ncbi:hypothetical protein YC2023_083396 [Brassica napus]
MCLVLCILNTLKVDFKFNEVFFCYLISYFILRSRSLMFFSDLRQTLKDFSEDFSEGKSSNAIYARRLPTKSSGSFRQSSVQSDTNRKYQVESKFIYVEEMISSSVCNNFVYGQFYDLYVIAQDSVGDSDKMKFKLVRLKYPGSTEVVQTRDRSEHGRCQGVTGSPCNGLRSRMLQPTCKFRSSQSSNPEADTPAGAPIPLEQSNLRKNTEVEFSFSVKNLANYDSDVSEVLIKKRDKGFHTPLNQTRNNQGNKHIVRENNYKLINEEKKPYHGNTPRIGSEMMSSEKISQWEQHVVVVDETEGLSN